MSKVAQALQIHPCHNQFAVPMPSSHITALTSQASTLHQRIQHALREGIVAGHYPPQAQMPTESALMRQYGVTPVVRTRG